MYENKPVDLQLIQRTFIDLQPTQASDVNDTQLRGSLFGLRFYSLADGSEDPVGFSGYLRQRVIQCGLCPVLCHDVVLCRRSVQSFDFDFLRLDASMLRLSGSHAPQESSGTGTPFKRVAYGRGA
jgi:hypothetical protein